MMTNIIIFGLNVPNWIFGVIALIVIALLILFSVISAREQAKIKAITDKEEKEEREKEEKKKGYYSLGDSFDLKKTFFSTLSYKLKVIWQVHEKATNDILTISSSWPIGMNEDDLKNFQDLLPELVSIKAVGEHQLSFKKSPAADFDLIKEAILKHLFFHLNKKYAWLDKNTTVFLEVYNNDKRKDEMLCKLEYRLKEHLAIGIMLGNIEGIMYKDKTITQMHCNSYTFDIQKDEEKSWGELIPLIKSVFVNYFPKDVEFTGNYPSVEKKSQSIKKENEEIDESNWTDVG